MEIRAPSYLTVRARSWVHSTAKLYDFEECELELLYQAAEALDRAERARRKIHRVGMIYINSHGHPVARPEIAIERDARALFARICALLKITEERK